VVFQDESRRYPTNSLRAGTPALWWVAHRPHKSRVGFQVDGPGRVARPNPRRPAARIAHFPGVMRPPGVPPLAAARRCPRALFLVSGAIATETRNKAKTLGGKTAHPGHPARGCGPQLRRIPCENRADTAKPPYFPRRPRA
jgi:hypothetical protein